MFLVLPGAFLYRFARQILTSPAKPECVISLQALKQFKQKRRLLEGNYVIDTVSYSQEELFAAHFESSREEGNLSSMGPDLKIHPSGITISATIYLFCIPVPRPLDAILSRWYPVKDGKIALYTRITVENQVFVENKRLIYRPKRIILGEKEIPSELLFLGRKFLPKIFTRGLPVSIGRVVLKEKEMIVYKPSPPEDDL